MKILSIDTSSSICGVSILENETLLGQWDTNTGRTHSERLMPMIKQALQELNITLSDIDLIVVDKGPGSFTGIRIGISTVMAFRDSLNIPCIGISSLEALAYNTQSNYICSLIDCKNDNCYFALYEKNSVGIESLIEPQAESLEGALSILKSYCEDSLERNPVITFIGDASEIHVTKIKEFFPESELASHNENVLNSYSLALAGIKKFKENQFDDILPLYLKKPQAQR